MCPCDYHQEPPDNKGVIGWGSELSGPEEEGGRTGKVSGTNLKNKNAPKKCQISAERRRGNEVDLRHNNDKREQSSIARANFELARHHLHIRTPYV